MLNYLVTRQELSTNQISILENRKLVFTKVCVIMDEIFYRILSNSCLDLSIEDFDECVIFEGVGDGNWSLLTPVEDGWFKLDLNGTNICDQIEESLEVPYAG